MSLKNHVVIGSRRSDLALWQTHHVIGLLQQAHPGLTAEIKIIVTKGDVTLDKSLPAIGGKGLFTEALETALVNGEIDLAVHSLKDLPTENPPGLIVGAIPQRGDPHDIVVSRDGRTLDMLPDGATVGTSSTRRAAQILNRYPHLNIIDIRGNVPTRIEKTIAADGAYDATILAKIGVHRLELSEYITEEIPYEMMLPAPGQGALGIQCRDEEASRALLAPLIHHETKIVVTAERAFLQALGGGCSIPVGALGTIADDQLTLTGRVSSVDGTRKIDVEETISLTRDDALATQLGNRLAQQALEQGAMSLLEITL